MEFELSTHAIDMMAEPRISQEWITRTINSPDWKELGKDNNMHYYKIIEEYGRRILHVVVNPTTSPPRVVTAFFDRRTRRH